MLSLGELSVAMPYTGSFHVYAKNLLLRQMENSGLVLKRGKAKAIRYRISENS